MPFKMHAILLYATCIVIAACIPSPNPKHTRLLRRSLGVNDGSTSTSTKFDYIIVGGGNARLALAARLSEVPSNRVAVIEAGGFYEDSVGSGSQLSIPAEDILWAGKNVTDTNPNVDWGFTTVPQAVKSSPSLLIQS